MCTNLSLLHAAGRVTDGGAAGGRGPSAPFQDRLQRKFALPGRMTGTFTEPGRGGPVPRSGDPGRQRKSTDACPSPCLPRTASRSSRTVHSLAGWMCPFPPQPALWSGRPTCRDGFRSNLALCLRRWGVPAANGRGESEVVIS